VFIVLLSNFEIQRLNNKILILLEEKSELLEKLENYKKSIAEVYGLEAKAIAYILPSKACNKIWRKKYGDRIYFYAYANLSDYSSMIAEDFEVISEVYDTVIIMIPGEDTRLFYYNLGIIDKIASSKGLRLLWVILPRWKYGREEDYLVPGTNINKLVLDLMKYLANLDSTWKIALWYGWTYRMNASDVLMFYENLPINLRNFYAVWLDQPYAEVAKKLSEEKPDFLVITELYSSDAISKYSGLLRYQMVVTGYENAKSPENWLRNICDKLKIINQTYAIGIWVFYDKGDGHGEKYSAYFPGEKLANPWTCIAVEE